MYAIILLQGKQYKISKGSIIKVFNIKFSIDDCFLINDILLIYFNNKYYFNDNIFIKNIFILCRVRSLFYKKFSILKMKRRKNNLKIIKRKIYYNEVLIEKFFFNFIK